MAYSMPPSDPRVLEITEEEVLFDLLVRHYHRLNGADEQERLLEHLKRNLKDLEEVERIADKIPTRPKPKPPAPAKLARRRKGVAP